MYIRIADEGHSVYKTDWIAFTPNGKVSFTSGIIHMTIDWAKIISISTNHPNA